MLGMIRQKGPNLQIHDVVNIPETRFSFEHIRIQC
jgi:hypothetical protein